MGSLVVPGPLLLYIGSGYDLSPLLTFAPGGPPYPILPLDATARPGADMTLKDFYTSFLFVDAKPRHTSAFMVEDFEEWITIQARVKNVLRYAQGKLSRWRSITDDVIWFEGGGDAAHLAARAADPLWNTPPLPSTSRFQQQSTDQPLTTLIYAFNTLDIELTSIPALANVFPLIDAVYVHGLHPHAQTGLADIIKLRRAYVIGGSWEGVRDVDFIRGTRDVCQTGPDSKLRLSIPRTPYAHSDPEPNDESNSPLVFRNTARSHWLSSRSSLSSGVTDIVAEDEDTDSLRPWEDSHKVERVERIRVLANVFGSDVVASTDINVGFDASPSSSVVQLSPSSILSSVSPDSYDGSSSPSPVPVVPSLPPLNRMPDSTAHFPHQSSLPSPTVLIHDANPSSDQSVSKPVDIRNGAAAVNLSPTSSDLEAPSLVGVSSATESTPGLTNVWSPSPSSNAVLTPPAPTPVRPSFLRQKLFNSFDDARLSSPKLHATSGSWRSLTFTAQTHGNSSYEHHPPVHIPIPQLAWSDSINDGSGGYYVMRTVEEGMRLSQLRREREQESPEDASDGCQDGERCACAVCAKTGRKRRKRLLIDIFRVRSGDPTPRRPRTAPPRLRLRPRPAATPPPVNTHFRSTSAGGPHTRFLLGNGSDVTSNSASETEVSEDDEGANRVSDAAGDGKQRVKKEGAGGQRGPGLWRSGWNTTIARAPINLFGGQLLRSRGQSATTKSGGNTSSSSPPRARSRLRERRMDISDFLSTSHISSHPPRIDTRHNSSTTTTTATATATVKTYPNNARVPIFPRSPYGPLSLDPDETRSCPNLKRSTQHLGGGTNSKIINQWGGSCRVSSQR